ncbi:hypothetical protein [Paenibacillus campi]|uniref:hypothetical protein n=1 Tax=Paenibacillus campi TaxID=3106031 RepID=UPI002AFED9E6|nr:hypothetical protein [Paenibacillus sp. SGZ-1014]
MYKKKINILVTFMLVVSLFFNPNYKAFAEPTVQSTELIGVSPQGIGSYPELEKLAREAAQKEDTESVQSFDIQSVNSDSSVTSDAYTDKATLDTKIRLMKEYGLNTEATTISKDEFYLVEKPKNEITTNGVSISAAWQITYIASPTGFKIFVTMLKGSSLNSVSGDVEKQTLNRDTWQPGTTSGFSQSNAKGTIFTWQTPAAAVAEAYIYDLKIKHNNQNYTYTNKGKYNEIRYNFVGGHYGKMAALGGERHHIVSSNSLSSVGLSSYSAPAVRMILKDHKTTKNYGSSAASKAYRAKELQYLKNKQYEQVLHYSIDNLKNVTDPGGVYNSLADKYASSLGDALVYAYSYFNLPTSS